MAAPKKPKQASQYRNVFAIDRVKLCSLPGRQSVSGKNGLQVSLHGLNDR